MNKKLKVYGWTGFRRESNPSHNGNPQTREIMAAKSKGEVARILSSKGKVEITETEDAGEIQLATHMPGIIFWKPLNHLTGSLWHCDDRNMAGKVLPFPVLTMDDAIRLTNYMGELGFWLKLTSPFVPYDPPVNQEARKVWEENRENWFASFDFHGATDTNPLWHAGSHKPEEAILLAALQVFEYLRMEESHG